MLKTILFAVTPLLLFVGTVQAGDVLDDIAGIDLASISDASADIEDFDLDGLDMDQLAENAGEETDAIEACFRRIGYRRHSGYGYGFRSCYRTYNHCYSHYNNYCHTSYYSPYYCSRPVTYAYRYCAPVFTSYWGCH